MRNDPVKIDYDEEEVADKLGRLAMRVLEVTGEGASKFMAEEHIPPTMLKALQMAIATLLGRGLVQDGEFEEALVETTKQIRDYARVVRVGQRPS